jgi:hypothetical protein
MATRSMRVAFRYEVRVENPTFSNHYEIACEEVSELSRRRRAPPDSLRPTVACDYAPFFWSQGFGLGGEGSSIAPSGRALPEQTKGSTVERRRLTDDGPEPEAVYLIEQKGQRVLGLVYATDSRMGLDAMCRLVERLPSVLERHGGGLVGISAESSEENKRRVVRRE